MVQVTELVPTWQPLERAMHDRHWPSLLPYLAEPGGDAWVAARAWWAARRVAWVRDAWSQRPAGYWDTARRGTEYDDQTCVRLLSTAFDTPKQAADALLHDGWVLASPTARTGEAVDAEARVRVFHDQVIARGAPWASELVERLASRRVNGWESTATGWLADLWVVCHRALGIGPPAAPGYAAAWVNRVNGLAAATVPVRAVPATPPRRGWERREPAPEEWEAARAALGAALRDEPLLADALSGALAEPGALLAWETATAEPGHLPRVLAELAARGVLDRRRVIADCLGALARQDRPAVAKNVTRILTALDLTDDEVREHLTLLMNVLPALHSAPYAALVPRLLAVVDAAQLEELGAVVLERKEKAPQAALKKALASGRWGDAAAGTRGLAEAEPPVLAPGEAERLWGATPAVEDIASLVAPAADEAGAEAALSRLEADDGTADAALLLDAVVRWAAADPRAAVAWAMRHSDGGMRTHLATAVDVLVSAARAAPGTVRVDLLSPGRSGEKPYAALLATIAEVHGDALARTEEAHRGEWDWAVRSRTPLAAWYSGFAAETSLRIGEIPCLVSTPTRTDGTLGLPTLLDRLRGYGRTPVGPRDLLLALLRVGPIGSTPNFDGIVAPLWSGPGGRSGLIGRLSRVPTAAGALAAWAGAGGLPPLRTRRETNATDVYDVVAGRQGPAGTVTVVAVEPLRLPAPLDALGGPPGGLLAGVPGFGGRHYWDDRLSAELDVASAPWWTDATAARFRDRFGQSTRFGAGELPRLAAAPAPGAATLEAALVALGHKDEDLRLAAADAVLTAIGRGWWDAPTAEAVLVGLAARDALRPSRAAHSWEQVFLGGGLAAFWPPAVAAVDALAAQPRTPAGLADLVGMLRRYVAAVPRAAMPAPPPSLAAFAAARGSSNARREAAAFVAAVEARP